MFVPPKGTHRNLCDKPRNYATESWKLQSPNLTPSFRIGFAIITWNNPKNRRNHYLSIFRGWFSHVTRLIAHLADPKDVRFTTTCTHGGPMAFGFVKGLVADVELQKNHNPTQNKNELFYYSFLTPKTYMLSFGIYRIKKKTRQFSHFWIHLDKILE